MEKFVGAHEVDPAVKVEGGQLGVRARKVWTLGPHTDLVRLDARNQFATAAQKMEDDPSPHLALARLYVYFLPNVEKATAEFWAAGLLGATFGRREIEQQADALRIRAQRQAATEPRLAWQDAQTARALYERIPGFDQVEGHLRELDRIRAPAPGCDPVIRTAA